MDIEQEVAALKERNKKVEADKAWEGSWVRRTAIVCITYVVAVGWMLVISETKPLLKALVPVAGYLLSTITIPPLKKYWLRSRLRQY